MKELRQALVIVWLIISVAGGFAVAAPFLLEESFLFRIFPACPSRLRGERCVACGMTTGFHAIAGGRWHDAQSANPGAIPLFFLLSANYFTAAVFALKNSELEDMRCNS